MRGHARPPAHGRGERARGRGRGEVVAGAVLCRGGCGGLIQVGAAALGGLSPLVARRVRRESARALLRRAQRLLVRVPAHERGPPSAPPAAAGSAARSAGSRAAIAVRGRSARVVAVLLRA